MVTILIVDDAAFMRNLIKSAIKNSEFEAIGEAACGEEAIELYKALRPHIVTMDITMPGKNGVEAVREIVEFDPEAKIVVCSAMGQKAYVKEAVEAGAKDFIVKPFAPELLIKHLRRVSGSGKSKREKGVQSRG